MAYEFTRSSSQYLSVGSAPATTTPLTIAAWFFPTVNEAGAICSIGVESGTNRHQIFYDPKESNLRRIAAQSVDNSGASESAINNTITLNAWQHGVGVFTSATNRRAYYNGSAGSANTVSRTPSGLNTITIGGRWNTTLGVIQDGRTAEVGIWNAALTAAEIASLAQGMTPDKIRPQSLVFYAPLVRDLVDVRGGLAITNNNAATVADHPRVYA
jgi:hypothetical protein